MPRQMVYWTDAEKQIICKYGLSVMRGKHSRNSATLLARQHLPGRSYGAVWSALIRFIKERCQALGTPIPPGNVAAFPKLSAKYADFAGGLSRARTAAGLSRAGLANKSGVDIATIFQVEQGTQTPSIYTVLRIADALQISTDLVCGRRTVPNG